MHSGFSEPRIIELLFQMQVRLTMSKPDTMKLLSPTDTAGWLFARTEENVVLVRKRMNRFVVPFELVT